jgi:hypothetical protein
MLSDMNINKYIEFSDTLLNNDKLRSFYTTSYGMELMLKLYNQSQSQSQSEVSMHIDELYASLKSGLPRREAFGKFINRLDSLGCIKKITHSQKKSMKSIVLNENIISELNKVFER